jgi:hypothetical protein
VKYRHFVHAVLAAALLAGCGGSQPPVGASGAISQNRVVATYGDSSGSWMLPDARSGQPIYAATGPLIYITNIIEDTVTVYRAGEVTPRFLDRLGAYFGLPAAPFDRR